MSIRGAESITAIEGNSRAFLRCLIAKEALGFKARFLLGDFQEYLNLSPPHYDFILASGVLYHMMNPIELIISMTKSTDSVGIWTHYYDAEVNASNPRTIGKFAAEPVVQEFAGESYELWPQGYAEALDRNDFSGGVESGSRWMTREGLIRLLENEGFSVTLGSEQRDHPHGSCILLYAHRR
jgi:hypothetical protein